MSKRLCSSCGTIAVSTGTFCSSCGASYLATSATIPTSQAAPASSNGLRGGVNPAFVWLAIVTGSIGVASTLLPYATDGTDSVNGWESARILSEYGEFAQGTILILGFSLAFAIAGLTHFTDFGRRQTAKTQGISTIMVGIFTIGATHATFLGWDSAARSEEVFVQSGLGLNLGYVVGLVMAIVGVLCLVVPNFFRKAGS